MQHILLVEDDINLGGLLQEYLQAKGYLTTWAKDGEEGWAQFVAETYDLCIFDVMMPRKDGFALAKEVRMSGRDVPIIFLTAKALKEDTIQGFKIGADDYLTKPFDREELLVRIQAVLRRYAKGKENAVETASVYSIGSYEFHFDLKELRRESTVQKLTSKESALLQLFCQNRNQPISRSYALKMIWGDDSYFNARSMDVYITKLRKHLREDNSIHIMNLHGEGFKFIA